MSIFLSLETHRNQLFYLKIRYSASHKFRSCEIANLKPINHATVSNLENGKMTKDI